MAGTSKKHIQVAILFRWLYLCTVTSSTIPPSIRPICEDLFTRKGGPCFTTNEQSQLLSRSLTASLTDFKTRALGLKYNAESLQGFLSDHHPFSNQTIQNLEEISWIENVDDMSVSKEIENQDSYEPNEVFRSHYNKLYVLGVYIKQIKSSRKIASFQSEQVTRERLNEFETRLYQLMCSLKSTLQSTRNDVISCSLNPVFTQLGSTLDYSYQRAYVTIQDSIKLMEFLIKCYEDMEQSI